jgi:hypothetical protein
LARAVVPLAPLSILTSLVFSSAVVQWMETVDVVPALALCPAVVPMALKQFLNPDHSVQRWLTAALALVLASVADENPVVQVVPVTLVVTAPQENKPKTMGRQATAGDAAAKTGRSFN